MNRREFLKRCGLLAAGAGLSPLLLELFSRRLYSSSIVPFKKEAMYYKKMANNVIQCELCPRGCRLREGERSFCRVREPKEGKLYSLVYGLACAAHIDPIEKKPLFHFLPATKSFSIATAGCNFRCKFCQNWSISQFPPEDTDNQVIMPVEAVKMASRSACATIAYTYTEPSIFFEYMLDTARFARAKGIRNIYHSNGSLNSQPLNELTKYLDGANIDLKAFDQDFYSRVCEGYLETVLRTLRTLKRKGVWVEITTLIVPTMNDDLDRIRQMSLWIKDNLGDETPLHFSRFWPQYRLASLLPTPISTLDAARDTAIKAGLKYVYVGNVPGHKAESTYCPKCARAVIKRSGYSVLEYNMDNKSCKFCGYEIAGVWT